MMNDDVMMMLEFSKNLIENIVHEYLICDFMLTEECPIIRSLNVCAKLFG